MWREESGPDKFSARAYKPFKLLTNAGPDLRSRHSSHHYWLSAGCSCVPTLPERRQPANKNGPEILVSEPNFLSCRLRAPATKIRAHKHNDSSYIKNLYLCQQG